MNYRWLASGLFLVTLATLMLEILDSRLLSVLTWYHLAFLTVSLAMLGDGSRCGARVCERRTPYGAARDSGTATRHGLVRFGHSR